jgi:hypothetical protein
MSGPSNIKIQKMGAEEVGNAQVSSPASDLERYTDPLQLSMTSSDTVLAMMTRGLSHERTRHDCLSTASGSWRNCRG